MEGLIFGILQYFTITGLRKSFLIPRTSLYRGSPY